MHTIRKSPFHPYTAENIHPGFSIDCVILSFYKKKFRILLNKFDISNYWQLPGGFMFKDEDSDEAAKRILFHRTGLKDIFLRQFYLFSDPNRTKMHQNTEYLEKNKQKTGFMDEEAWFLRRFVSLGYYALVKYDDITLPKVKEDMAKWFPIDNLPPLYSDHENIIKKALEIIRTSLPLIPIGYELLPEKFAISELRRIYEIILNRALDRRNFQRKVLATGVIIQLDETKDTSTYNPAILYKFDKDRKDMLENPFL